MPGGLKIDSDLTNIYLQIDGNEVEEVSGTKFSELQLTTNCLGNHISLHLIKFASFHV